MANGQAQQQFSPAAFALNEGGQLSETELNQQMLQEMLEQQTIDQARSRPDVSSPDDNVQALQQVIEEAPDDVVEDAKKITDNEESLALALKKASGESDDGFIDNAMDSFDRLTNAEKVAIATLAIVPLIGGFIGGQEGALIGVGASGEGLKAFGQTKLKKQQSKARSAQDLAFQRMLAGQSFQSVQQDKKIEAQKVLQTQRLTAKQKADKIKQEIERARQIDNKIDQVFERGRKRQEKEDDRAFKLKRDKLANQRKLGKESRQARTRLQRDWDRSPEKKYFQGANASVRNLADLLRTGKTGISDVLAIIAINKTYDPGGVVRPSEADSTREAQPWLDRLKNLGERVKTGSILTPEAKKELSKIGENLLRVNLGILESRVKEIRERATIDGVNPDEVIPSTLISDYRNNFKELFGELNKSFIAPEETDQKEQEPKKEEKSGLSVPGVGEFIRDPKTGKIRRAK